MITFLTTAKHRYTIDGLRKVWAASLAHHLRVLPYERLFCMRSVPGGVYIFTDLDRLSEKDGERAREWYQILRDAGACVLNDPSCFVDRLELLQRLYAAGKNQFNVYTFDQIDKVRYPVFLRYNEGHDGNQSDLINDRATLDGALKRLKRQADGRTPLIIEFLDYSETDGRFYKYSHFRVGDHLVYGGLACGSSWCVKASEFIEQELLEREIIDGENHQFDQAIMDAFQMTGIEYGRIDYAFVDGKLQIFEINTNPDMGFTRPKDLARWRIRSRNYQLVNEALWELCMSSSRESRIETPGRFQPGYVLRRWLTLPRLCAKRIRKFLYPNG